MRKVAVLACILSLLVSAAVLAGCGGGSSAQTPQQVVQAYFTSLQKADATTIWNLISAASQKTVGSKSKLESALKSQSATFKSVKFTVGKTTVNGDKATVEVTVTIGGKTSTETLPLIKENGVWKGDMTSSTQ
jgi:uncharacterized protein YdeI (BOF family)